MRKLRVRDIKWFTQWHIYSKKQNWNSNPTQNGIQNSIWLPKVAGIKRDKEYEVSSQQHTLNVVTIIIVMLAAAGLNLWQAF